jgi:hypothetical protein
MVFKRERERVKISNASKVFGTIFFIVCVILGVMVTFAIHFDILLTNSPGYPFDEFAIKYLWMDILLGIGIGIALFIIISIVIAYYFALRRNANID